MNSVSLSNIFEDERSKWIIFTTICILGLVMRLACTTGLIASDDLGYSHFAQMIAKGLYVPELHHYTLRYGLTVPVAVVYWLFGVKEWTTILVPLLASVASIPLFMMIAWKLCDFRTALIAGILFATFPIQLIYATILVPEPIAEFYILIAVLVFLHSQDEQPLLLGIVTGICLGIAYLTKESSVFVAPALIIYDCTKRRWKSSLGIVIGLTIVVSLEQLYYLAVTGDLLYRFHVTTLVHNKTPMAVDANLDLRYRLIKAYPRMMILPNIHFGLHSLFSLSLSFFGLFLLRIDRFRLLILWALLPWIYLNFGTSSLSHYFALPVAHRYLEFVYPPLFIIAAAIILHQIYTRNRIIWLAVSTIFLVASIGFFCDFAARSQKPYSLDVSALRLIATRARDKNLNSVQFEGPDSFNRWKNTMAILAPDLKITSKPESADIVIRPDDLGLPSVAPKLNSDHHINSTSLLFPSEQD